MGEIAVSACGLCVVLPNGSNFPCLAGFFQAVTWRSTPGKCVLHCAWDRAEKEQVFDICLQRLYLGLTIPMREASYKNGASLTRHL
jgi:hypothetical protein